MKMRVGSPEELRQLRLLAGYSFRDLQRRTGVSGAWLCQHERRRYVLPLRHQETVFVFLLQAVRDRAAAVDQVLARIDEPALVEAEARGS